MPGGQQVATNAYGYGGFVKIWEVGSGRLVGRSGTTRMQRDPKETSFDVNPDGELVAIMSGNQMRVWRGGAPPRKSSPCGATGWSQAAGTPRETWSSRGEPTDSRGSSTVPGASSQTLSTGWDEEVFDARFSPDGRLVATTRNDEETWLWDWDRGKVISKIPDDGP